MKYMPGFTDFFMSPVTGRINLFQFPDVPDEYIIMGGLDDRPYLSPIVIDLRLEIIELRNRLSRTSFILQHASPNFDKAQALDELIPGILRHTDGVVSIAIPGSDYLSITLPYHQVWLGNEENVATPVDRIWDDGVGHGNLPAYTETEYNKIWVMNEDGVPILSDALTSAEGSITDILSQIADIISDIAGIISDIAGIVSDISSIFDSIATITGNIASIFDSIASILSTLGGIAIEITTIEDAIITINAEIVLINDALAIIDTQITGILTAITDIQTAITGILSSITDIEANITTIFSSITDINIALGGIGIRLDGFDVSIDGLQAQIDTNISSGLDHLADLQGQIDLGISSGMDHLATLNGQIDDINTSITDIITSITDLTTAISDITTAIGDGSVTLIGDVTGAGSISTPIATTLTVTLDQVPLALGDISANINKITDLVDPVDPQDAATKNYVDSLGGSIELTGNVLGTGVLGTPFNTDLNSNILTTTGDQTFSYPSAAPSTAFALINTCTPTLLTPSNMELTLENSIGSGFQFNLSSGIAGGSFPDGVFQFYAFTSGGSTLIYTATSDLVTFNIPVTMTTELSMAANEINNLAMNGSPAGTDAVNVDYLNSQIGAGEITLTGAVSGTGFVNDSIATLLNDFIFCDVSSSFQTFSFADVHYETDFSLDNNFPYSPSDPSSCNIWIRNKDGNGYILQTYSDSAFAGDGVFYLRQKGFVQEPLFKVDYVGGFCPFVKIDMQSNEINNLSMAGSPTGTDAVNVDYLNSQISDEIAAQTIELAGDVSGFGSLGSPITTTFNLTLDQIGCDGNIDVDSHYILGVLDPVSGAQAANKNYVDTKFAAVPSSITLTGAVTGTGATGTPFATTLATTLNNVPAPTGNVSLNSHKITSLLDPTSAQDGATMNYVDTRSITLTGSVTGTAALGSSLATTLTTTLNNVPIPTGNVSLNSFKITSLLDPTSAQDGATKNYIDTRSITLTGSVTGTASLGSSLATTLTTVLNSVPAPTGNLSLNSKKITNLLDPTAAQDAATKNYVDSSKACGGMYNTATSGTQSLTLNIWNSLTTTFDTSINLSNFTKTANNVLKYTGSATIYVTVNACLGFSFSTLANIYFGISKNGGTPSPQATGPLQCTASSLYTSSCTALLQLSTNDTVGVYCFTNVSGTFSNSICSMNVSSVQ